MKYERLAPFWEAGERPTFPLSRGSEFGRRISGIFDEAVQQGIDAGGTGFEIETNVEWSKKIAAVRIQLTCDVLGEDLGTIARRIGSSPGTFSRIVQGHTACPYLIERAIYRELLHFAVLQWVNAWVVPEARAEFDNAYLANPIDFGGHTIDADPVHGLEAQEVRGLPITDNFGRALFAIGVACGPDGWRDFWKDVGRHLYPIPAYESSAQFYTQRVKERRKRLKAVATDE